MRLVLSRLFLLVGLLLGWLTAFPVLLVAQSAEAYLTRIPDPKRLGEAYVSNPDGVLSVGTVADLNATLRPLDQSGRAHLDVVAVNSIGEAEPKTAATALFNRWKIGDKTKDNGLLMLVVMDQRRVEFETGYGLEADVPDVVCYRIQQRYMVPLLRAGNTDEAIRQGVAALLRQLRTGSFAEASSDSTTALALGSAAGSATDVTTEEYAEAPTANPLPWIVGSLLIGLAALTIYGMIWYYTTQGHAYRPLLAFAMLLPVGLTGLALFDAGNVNGWLLLAVLYGLPWLYLGVYFRRVVRTWQRDYTTQSRHAQYRYLRQAHHGLDFIRYLFPLPFARYWRGHRQQLQQLREAPYTCPQCNLAMQRLGENQEDPFLKKGEQVEERIKSVEYDVWRCETCQHTLKLDYYNHDTDAKPCPACQFHTFTDRGQQVVEAATRLSEGWGWERTRCHHCMHEEKTRYTIPRIADSSSSSSSGSSSGSSGGSSSSSGGSSGGGGAGSSW